VLIIDHDVPASDSYARVLKPAGLAVITTRTGEEGLQQVRIGRPDVIITESRLPDMNGLDLLRRLQHSPARRTPVTVVTDDYFIDDQARRDLMALHADVCFKPMWPDNLLAIALGSPRPPVPVR
jgi:DNA-binding response OmpR family regulator